MAASAGRDAGPASTLTISDLLPQLPLEAQRAIFDDAGLLVGHLRLSRDDLRNARLACRAFAQAFDSSRTKVTMGVAASAPEIVSMCQGGRWLQRRPQCIKVELRWRDARVCLPFAWAAPEDCKRITELAVGDTDGDGWDPPLSSGVLHGLLLRLPGLRTLALNVAAPDRNAPLERDLATIALSLLPNLTALVISDYGWLPCLPDSLVTGLTSLEAGNRSWDLGRLTVDDLAALAARMTALQELEIKPMAFDTFEFMAVASLLDALPPSAHRLTVYGVDEDMDLKVTCRMSGGFLGEVEVCGNAHTTYREVSELLARGLLPSSRLGPRLGHLKSTNALCTHDGVPDPDPGAAVLARCDKITVPELFANPNLEETLSVVRAYGLPESIVWDGGAGRDYLVEGILLGRPKAAVASRAGDGGWTAPLPPVLTPTELEGQVVEHMQGAAARPHGSTLLLRGPLARTLASDPAGLRAWMERLRSAVSAANPTHHLWSYQAFPCAGAVEVAWAGAPASEVAAAVVRALAAKGGSGGSSGGAEAAAELEVIPACQTFMSALQKVLQALWDGEEAVTGGAGSGEAGGSSSGAGASGGVPGDGLERLRCLLETWGGLRSLPAVGYLTGDWV